MNKIAVFSVAILCWIAGTSTSHAQQVDQKILEQLRKRYQHSFESIYVTDSSLNNLSVHLRAERTIESLTKGGTHIDVLNTLRKFLVEIANDRAFLQLELRALRAGFKKQSDASASIQQLPWTDREVFHIAVLCDRYLQGQITLAALNKLLAGGNITISDGWTKLDEIRRNPYIPAVTMTGSLRDFISYATRSESQLVLLASTNPVAFKGITTFTAHATDANTPIPISTIADWPSVVRTEWIKRHKVLEGYAKSTDATAAPVWLKQLEGLQELEYAKLVRGTETPRAE